MASEASQVRTEKSAMHFQQSALPLPYTDTRLVAEIPKVFQVKHNWSISRAWSPTEFWLQPFFVPITNATSDGVVRTVRPQGAVPRSMCCGTEIGVLTVAEVRNEEAAVSSFLTLS